MRLLSTNSLPSLTGTLLFVMLFTTSCQRQSVQSSREQDSIIALRADSLISQAKATRHQERVLTVIDSLEHVGLIGPIRANFERGMILHVFKERRAIKEYWKHATSLEISNRQEETYYYQAVAMLSNLLQTDHDFEGALRLSVKSLERMKQSDMCKPRHIGILLGDIGICQLKTGRFDEAAKTFNESYLYFLRGIAADTTRLSLENAIIITGNTSIFYVDAHRYNDAYFWVQRVDTLLQTYRQQPKIDSIFYDRQYARRCNRLACILQGQGRKTEAAAMFREYQNTDSYKKGIEHAPGEYLMAAGRYAEATEAYADIEEQIRQRVGRPSLDIIQQYIFPKFRANAGAGYQDSAVAIGSRILDALDSAIVWQKQDDAAELATIYETQEKDRQIAQQEVALSHQRFVTSAIVFALIVIALTIFIFFRHKSVKRLEEAHEELKEAYDKLEETTAIKEQIQSELRIARDIQMSMVPSVFPKSDVLDMYASMTPAKEVGGDLYGYITQGDNLYFCIGDVSGKGVPASLFMAQATRLFRTLASQGMQPAEICTRMNEALAGEDNINGMFVTMFLGLVNLATGHLSFCNAGHNPPVIGGDEHHGSFLQMVPNAPIGLWPGLEFEGEEIENIKNKPLFIYTDGLNEAENQQQEQFGDDRLLKILQHTKFEDARQVVETLSAEVERHRKGAEPNDDLTMMCIRIK